MAHQPERLSAEALVKLADQDAGLTERSDALKARGAEFEAKPKVKPPKPSSLFPVGVVPVALP